MLIILKPSTFPTAFEHHLCVLSVPIRDTNALSAVFLCVCVFEKAGDAMWPHIAFLLCTH